jgi:hypothetical protein
VWTEFYWPNLFIYDLFNDAVSSSNYTASNDTELTCSREVLGSKLGRNTGYSDRFFVVSLSPSRQMPGEYLEQAMITSFQILSNL